MKYQHILNGELLFETNNVSDFFVYLNTKENNQAKSSILYNLLEKSHGYVCNMINSSYQDMKNESELNALESQ